MLISKKDIANISPPLLMKQADGGWKLVTSIVMHETCEIGILEKHNGEFIQRVISQEEAPFYVGEDIWELNYGSTIMTLSHASLKGHPANRLWEEWKSVN